MSKEVNRVLRGLRQYADPPSSFNVHQNKHIKVKWEMLNDNGKRVTVTTVMGWTPRDCNWMKSHKKQLQHTFRELHISTEVNHI